MFEIEGDLRHERGSQDSPPWSTTVLGCTGSLLAGPKQIGISGQHCAKARAQNMPTHGSENPKYLGLSKPASASGVTMDLLLHGLVNPCHL